MKLQWKSVLNFKVHSQLLLCAEQLVILKENQICSQWKWLDIKSTWGEIQLNIWMNVRVPLLPTYQLWAGNSISISNHVLVGLKWQRGSRVAGVCLPVFSFHAYSLSMRTIICHIPLAGSEHSPQLYSRPLSTLVLSLSRIDTSSLSYLFTLILKSLILPPQLLNAISVYISVNAGMTEEKVRSVQTGR